MRYFKFKKLSSGRTFIAPESTIVKVEIGKSGVYKATFIEYAAKTTGIASAEILDPPKEMIDLL